MQSFVALLAALFSLQACAQVTANSIVFRDDQLVFNGKPLTLGQGLSAWDEVLPGERRCEGAKVDVCAWDSIGLMVVMQNKDPNKIASVKVLLRPHEQAHRRPMLPKSVYAGKLELDGYAFDSETKFWEVRQNSRKERGIRCGLRECALPGGQLGERTIIYFALSKPTENGTINEVELGGPEL